MKKTNCKSTEKGKGLKQGFSAAFPILIAFKGATLIWTQNLQYIAVWCLALVSNAYSNLDSCTRGDVSGDIRAWGMSGDKDT